MTALLSSAMVLTLPGVNELKEFENKKGVLHLGEVLIYGEF